MQDNHPRISPATTDRIMQVAQEIEYRPTSQERMAINAIQQTLVGNERGVREIPEADFRQYFVNALAGNLPEAETKQRLGEWVAVAGNEFTPVKVIHPNGTVTVVPSLLDRGVFSELPASISAVTGMDIVDRTRRNDPVAGDNLSMELSARVASIVTTPQDIGAEERQNWAKQWRQVFDKFGVVPNATASASTKQKPVDRNWGEEDEVDL